MSDIDYLLDAKRNGTDVPMWTGRSGNEYDFHASMTEILYYRGISLGGLGRFDEAYDDFTECINDEDPQTELFERYDLYFRRGEMLILLNQYDEGCPDIKNAAEMGHPEAEYIFNEYCLYGPMK